MRSVIESMAGFAVAAKRVVQLVSGDHAAAPRKSDRHFISVGGESVSVEGTGEDQRESCGHQS